MMKLFNGNNFLFIFMKYLDFVIVHFIFSYRMGIIIFVSTEYMDNTSLYMN